ncbi:S1C family serine protease [Defluviimonas sp. D31]|uniref:S1C family serine protease n=1 Tax=Defluviimonas sp. D31 TaxID=3083253 RepID=UPI00296FDD25|nr:S1C family serine protease [Defluviimonas sp. D31]MDW4551111.1 S1C family serine protease [Defluviimonas sp. D31]
MKGRRWPGPVSALLQINAVLAKVPYQGFMENNPEGTRQGGSRTASCTEGQLFSAAVLLVGAMIAMVTAAGPVRAAGGHCEISASEIFTSTGKSVVEVFSIAINPFLVADRLLPRGGSGIVLDNGYVVTNYHVVADASTVVVFTEEGGAETTVVGIDPPLDIAVLRPRWGADKKVPIASAENSEVTIGQTAYTIGYPLGLGKSISSGIVSGYGRVLPVTTSSWLSPFVQTDAAISPGNSGGPLVDECGRMIGMMTKGIEPGRGEDLGFAIPLSVLLPVVDELIEKGRVSRPWHGLYGQFTTPAIMLMLGVPSQEWDQTAGFLVETVEPGSAADRAGLKGGAWPVRWGPTQILLGGEIITHVDGARIDSLDAAIEMVRALRVGQTVRIRGFREGLPFAVQVTLEERPLIAEELELYRHAR